MQKDSRLTNPQLPRFRSRLTKWKTVACFVILSILFAEDSWSVDLVSPLDGTLTVTQTDQQLMTRGGLLPITRNFYSAQGQPGILGPGWSLDVVSRLDFTKDKRLIITQSGAETILVQKDNQKQYEGPGGAKAYLQHDQWIVDSPAKVTSIYDLKGREVSRRDANENTITFDYDQDGRLRQIHAVRERPLRLFYAQNGLLTAIQEASGKKSEYRYDSTGRLSGARNADGWETVFSYTKDGKLSGIHYPQGEQVSFTYEESGRVSKRASSTGFTYSYSYGPATRITRHDGFWVEMTFDAEGAPIKYQDSLTREQSWSWNEHGLPGERRFFDGSSSTYAYDRQGRLVRQETDRGDILKISYDGESSRPILADFNDAVTRFTYDQKGNLLSITSPAGRKVTYGYDGHGRRISVTDGEKRTTRLEYDSVGNIVKQISPDGAATTWEYDKSCRIIRQRDPLDRTMSYAYHPNGLLASITQPGQEAVSYRYDNQGRLIEQTTGTDAIQYTYGQNGLLVRIDYPDKSFNEFSYDSLGNPLKITDAMGRVTRLEYDQVGRLIKTTLPSGEVDSAAISASGNVERLTIGQNKIEIASKEKGKVICLRDTTGAESRLTRDMWGRVTSMVFPRGGQHLNWYDPDGFLELVVLPMGDVWRFKHDGAGQLQEMTSPFYPEGWKQLFSYDAAGRLASITDPEGKTVSYRYNPAGLLVEKTNAHGQKIEYGYDQHGRLTSKKTPQDTWSYQYESRGNLSQATNGTFTVHTAYDSLSRLIKTEFLEWGKVIKYQYDNFGRVVSCTDPDGKQTRYVYDQLGRVSKIVGLGGEAFVFEYGNADRLIQRKAPNGTVTEYNYDETGRIISITHSDQSGHVLVSRRCRYDADGNLLELIDEEGLKSSYQYDLQRRLISEAAPGIRKTYAYGWGGNRLGVEEGSQRIVYRYDAAGRLTGAGTRSYAYDADGNLVSRQDNDGTTRYFYDAEGNLVRVELPNGKAVTYGYGPLGRRIWREEDGDKKYYLLDGDNLLQELSADFTSLTTYLCAGLDRPLLASFQGGGKAFSHEDLLGSVVALTDARGKVSGRYAYDAFGNVAQQKGRASLQPPRFTGQPLDAATRLYDLRARYYDPEVGRFISRDPVLGQIDDPVSLAPYLYARNNPLSYVDHSGRDAQRLLLLPPGASPPLALPPGASPPLALPRSPLALPPARGFWQAPSKSTATKAGMALAGGMVLGELLAPAFHTWDPEKYPDIGLCESAKNAGKTLLIITVVKVGTSYVLFPVLVKAASALAPNAAAAAAPFAPAAVVIGASGFKVGQAIYYGKQAEDAVEREHWNKFLAKRQIARLISGKEKFGPSVYSDRTLGNLDKNLKQLSALRAKMAELIKERGKLKSKHEEIKRMYEKEIEPIDKRPPNMVTELQALDIKYPILESSVVAIEKKADMVCEASEKTDARMSEYVRKKTEELETEADKLIDRFTKDSTYETVLQKIAELITEATDKEDKLAELIANMEKESEWISSRVDGPWIKKLYKEFKDLRAEAQNMQRAIVYELNLIKDLKVVSQGKRASYRSAAAVPLEKMADPIESRQYRAGKYPDQAKLVLKKVTDFKNKATELKTKTETQRELDEALKKRIGTAVNRAKACAGREDPFVGAWLGMFQITQHSHNSIGEPTTGTFTIKKSGDTYSVQGLGLTKINTVTAQRNTITIEATTRSIVEHRTPQGVVKIEQLDVDIIKLSLGADGRGLTGTWRTDTFQGGKRHSWQEQSIKAVRP